MLIIEVRQVQTKSRDFPSKDKEGKIIPGETYTRKDQFAYIYNFFANGFKSDEPRHIALPLEGEQHPYNPGLYVISDESFYFGQYDAFKLGRLRLVPLDLASLQSESRQVVAQIEMRKKMLAQALTDAVKQAA